MELLEYLRELNMASLTVRLVLALAFGGAIGLERVRKRRPAGFRTHMLVCIGAALTMVLSQYQYIMLETVWAQSMETVGGQMDISRFGAQVINGIGFLGAGTILVTGQRQQIKGLTTAAGLWASATMGLAIGAGFYEGVFVAFMLMQLTIRVLPYLETWMVQYARDMMVYVEFQKVENMNEILHDIKGNNVMVRQVDIDHGGRAPFYNPSAVLTLRLPSKCKHEEVLSCISSADGLYVIEEL